ncbi:3-oxoacyl-ACP reductase [Rhizobium dioscoreae]|uniref:3-oxoacyl-ACP reductase n=1 Tax=Rhizobium dioscoreae TaxID=2653122 RepID=A0ABQ0ZCH1_9HYPH|nr:MULTISPECIES: 3-oxoacyl-ACP reductase [Rhizobium]MCZ3379877.1 3-oxoacyl-ACP reductase [Rhizobium sp. AG207R]GES46721.1 3-oxoacyl-ACP reductase [Rhizobium dioscoreae]GES53078.1 3-oxoacyl-ACP reductase [Rhizobium dioscoreae]GLU84515.1 3-oxoacyl-ACP reductase [Rhizobium sp. NBRC 114257]
MSLSLKDQIVIVSGAGRGLGAAIATAFAREGAKVAVNYRASRESAEALAAKLGDHAKAFQADIRDLDDTKRLVFEVTGHFGVPTTIVHNALADFSFNGDARSKLDALSWAEMTRQLETALEGALNLIQAARPAMAQAGFGRIVTIGTNLFQNPVVPYHDYTAAKAALLSLTRTAAAELGPLGITVNMVSGGLLRTTDASGATPEAVFDIIAANTPLRRVTTPHEVADAVLFFASPWARAVTGQNLIVDGGLVFG